MNNKIFFLALALTVFIITLNYINAIDVGISDYAYLTNVSNPTFLPSNLNAGDIVSLAINIQNKGSITNIENMLATLDLGTQFEALDINQDLGTIIPQTSKTAVFKFKVKDNTVSGYYPATMNMDYLRDGEKVNEKYSLTIVVSNSQKRLDISISPNVINPGNETEMIFSLTNLTGAPVSNISITWNEKSGLILPLGSDNKKYISTIEANSTEVINTLIASDPNITPGIYTLDLNVTYSSLNGLQNQTSEIGLIVGGKTDFEISAEMQSSTLALSIANIGSNNAGAVVVKIPKQQIVNVNGTNTAVLGNINKGDFTLANFSVRTQDLNAVNSINFKSQRLDMNIKDFNKQNNNLLLEIDYTDTTGKRQIIQKEITLNTSTSSLSTVKTTTSSFPTWPLILLIIILGAGTLYNYFKAKKSWSNFGFYAVIILILFLLTVYLFSSNTILLIVVTLISIILLLWFFFKKNKK